MVSKAALIGIARSLAKPLGEQGITKVTRVCAVVCGFGDAIVASAGDAGSTPPWIA